MNKKPTELKRQTGRTTRMIQDAVDTVVRGWNVNTRVVVIMHDVNMTLYAENLIKEYLRGKGLIEINQVTMRVMFMHLRHNHMEYINVNRVEGMGPYKRWPIFIDHDAAMKLMGFNLLEAWLKYDLDEPGSAAYQSLMKSQREASVSEDVANGVYTTNDLPMAENGEIRQKPKASFHHRPAPIGEESIPIIHGDRDSY